MNQPIRVAVNGFGRIGRSVFRVLLDTPGVEVAAVNDLHDAATLAHLLRYDSVHGRLGREVEASGEVLRVDGRAARALASAEPEALPWRELAVDVVLECTGRFVEAGARGHLAAGASRVVVSAPSDEADLTVVMGVNHETFDPDRHRVVSAASCTTNCLAPVAKVMHETFGIRKGLVTTVHSYTNDQKLVDHPHRDLRRARSAALSIIPTTTGAARAVGLVLPELEGRLDGVSVRVPTPDVSLADITLLLGRAVTPGEVNDALRRSAEGPLRGVLGYSDEPLVSVDYVRCPLSAVVDGLQTRVTDGDLVKLSAWYDNEWGYANRLADLIGWMARRGAFPGT